jgi:uncharacterized protein
MGDTRGGHIPERRCLGCGVRAPKASLARFTAVAGEDGPVLMRDDGALLGGRGLYVCRQAECFERAAARRAFARAGRIRGEIVIDRHLVAGLGEEE